MFAVPAFVWVQDQGPLTDPVEHINLEQEITIKSSSGAVESWVLARVIEAVSTQKDFL
jgi:hypothetical protein